MIGQYVLSSLLCADIVDMEIIMSKKEVLIKVFKTQQGKTNLIVMIAGILLSTVINIFFKSGNLVFILNFLCIGAVMTASSSLSKMIMLVSSGQDVDKKR
jgi:hypothetical protein